MRLLTALLTSIVVLTGCQNNDDGIDHAKVAAAQAPLKSAAERTGGDWSKMTPEEQKLFLDRARGNETAAQSMAGMMARPPAGGPKH